MDWVKRLQQTHSVWPPELFNKSILDYNLTVYIFLALAKGVVGDINGAALQLRRASRHIQYTRSGNACYDIALDLIEDFQSCWLSNY